MKEAPRNPDGITEVCVEGQTKKGFLNVTDVMRENRIKSEKTPFFRRTSVRIGGAIVAGVIAFGGVTLAPTCNSNLASENRTTTAASAAATPTIPENTPALAENNVDLESIGTPENAAQLFGADTFSKDPANWTIGENGNAAALNTPSDGTLTRVNTNGAVVEGWINAKELNENTSFNAIAILAGPNQKQLDLDGGTFRKFKDPIKGFQELEAKLVSKESAEQPGVIVFEACLNPDLSSTKWANTLKFGSLQEVAQRFGVDSYSLNPANWELIEKNTGAHLKVRADGYVTRIKLSGNAVAEGYLNALTRTENTNFGAVSFVAHPSQGFIDGQGFTVWNFENADAGFAQLAKQHIAAEQQSQPGTVTLLLEKCAVRPVCEPCTKKVVPPAPEVKVECPWPTTPEEAAKEFGLDDYSRNSQNWVPVGNDHWHMGSNNQEHLVQFCGRVAIGYYYKDVPVDLQKLHNFDPMQEIVTLGLTSFRLQSVDIYDHKGLQAAIDMYKIYVNGHPNELLPVETVGFTPGKDQSGQ